MPRQKRSEPVVEKAPSVPGGPVAEMEAEGQGQSTSVPPAPDGQRRRPGASDVERVPDDAGGARADQDIDTAGSGLDEP